MLLDTVDVCCFCVHWTHQPCEEGWGDACIQLSTPFRIWEDLSEPARDLWKSLYNSISLLLCRFALKHAHLVPQTMPGTMGCLLILSTTLMLDYQVARDFCTVMPSPS